MQRDTSFSLISEKITKNSLYLVIAEPIKKEYQFQNGLSFSDIDCSLDNIAL